MLDYLFLFAGIALIVMVISDFAVTVFIPRGAGFITGGITVFVAKIFKFLSGNTGIKRILEYKLVFIIAIMIISWLFLIWIAVALIFSSDASQKIRVNAVAPGPIWTPLIPTTFDEEEVDKFGENVPLERPVQPCEVATSYVFLASEDASYITGQVMHPNGGKTMQS